MEIWGGGYYTILDKYTDTELKEAAVLQSPSDHQPCQVSGTKVGTHQHQPKETLLLRPAFD